MLIHYHATGATSDGVPITGSVVFESLAELETTMVRFTIRSFAFLAGDQSYLMSEGDSGSLVIQHHHRDVNWTNGRAIFGVWDNDANGVRFGYNDNTYFEDPAPIGFYKHLPARMKICTKGIGRTTTLSRLPSYSTSADSTISHPTTEIGSPLN